MLGRECIEDGIGPQTGGAASRELPAGGGAHSPLTRRLALSLACRLCGVWGLLAPERSTLARILVPAGVATWQGASFQSTPPEIFPQLETFEAYTYMHTYIHPCMHTYIHKLHAYITCIHCMHTLHAYTDCIHCMHTLHAYIAYMRCIHTLHTYIKIYMYIYVFSILPICRTDCCETALCHAKNFSRTHALF